MRTAEQEEGTVGISGATLKVFKIHFITAVDEFERIHRAHTSVGFGELCEGRVDGGLHEHLAARLSKGADGNGKAKAHRGAIVDFGFTEGEVVLAPAPRNSGTFEHARMAVGIAKNLRVDNFLHSGDNRLR